MKIRKVIMCSQPPSNDQEWVPHNWSANGMPPATARIAAKRRGGGLHVPLPPSAIGCPVERIWIREVQSALAPTCTLPSLENPLGACTNFLGRGLLPLLFLWISWARYYYCKTGFTLSVASLHAAHDARIRIPILVYGGEWQ